MTPFVVNMPLGGTYVAWDEEGRYQMDAIFSWFQRTEKVQFMAIEGRALTFKSKKTFKVGSRPTISIAIPIASGGAEDFKLPVTISKVRQVGPNAVVCTGLVPGAAKSVEHLRQILQGLDPSSASPSDSDDLDDSDSMRRAPRYTWSIRVLSKDLPGFRAISLDFNRLGVKLSTEGAVEEGKIMTMMLEIETAKTKELLCQGLVRWSREIGRRKYEVGIEFTELDSIVAKELENFESFLADRQSGDVAKRQIQDSGIYEEDAFGPGVEQEAKEAKEKAEAEEMARLQPEPPAAPSAQASPASPPAPAPPVVAPPPPPAMPSPAPSVDATPTPETPPPTPSAAPPFEAPSAPAPESAAVPPTPPATPSAVPPFEAPAAPAPESTHVPPTLPATPSAVPPFEAPSAPAPDSATIPPPATPSAVPPFVVPPAPDTESRETTE